MNENAQAKGGCPMWLKAVLVVSLVANLAIAGLYLGHMSKPSGKARGSERQIGWILKFVPEERHADAEKLFDAKRDEIRELSRKRTAYLEEIVTAIRAEPFAPETLEAAMRARRENSSARRVIVEKTLTTMLVDFSIDDRNHFADQMEERLRKWRERGAR